MNCSRNLLVRASVTALFGALLAQGCATTQEKKVDTTPVVVAPTAPKEKTVEELFADGVKAYDQAKYDEAKKAFSTVTEKSQDSVTAWFDLGLANEKLGDVASAKEAYETALKLDPHHRGSLLNLGHVFRVQAKFDKAIALFDQALKEAGHEYDPELLNNLTVAYRMAKKYDLAEQTVRKLLSRTKDNPEAYKNLALIYYDQGNYRLAEFISGNALKLDEKDPGIYNNLGMIFLKVDDRARALAQFQKAVELNPKFAPGHMNIGAMALSYRDYEGAERELKAALAQEPNLPEAHLYLAQALDGEKGRDPKKGVVAGAEFERYLSLRPDSPEAVCGAGWAYAADRSGFDKAVPFLEKCKATASAQDAQLIDAKLKGIAAMQKAGQTAQKTPEKKDAAKKGDTSLLDKVTEDAAKQEAQTPENGGTAPAPNGGQAAPNGQGQTPSGAGTTPASTQGGTAPGGGTSH